MCTDFENVFIGGPGDSDVVIGRVYSYDYSVKLLILSKLVMAEPPTHRTTDFNSFVIVLSETVHNPGTPEESYADSVMINARNIRNVEILEQAGAASSDGGEARSTTTVAPIAPEDMIREFAMGDQSRLDQKRLLMHMEQRIKERQ